MALLGALLVAGCTGIPTSGPVERVEDESGLGESSVRYTPAGPATNASEEQIVRGFLDAMLAYPVTNRVAAEYLTPQAAQRWRPGRSTTVYTEASVFHVASGSAWIDLTTESELDAQGQLVQVVEPKRIDLDLRRVDGQWRIANPPNGVLVSRDWFDDYVRAFDLYFLDPNGRHVVPVPVHEVVGDQLATSLMTSLAIGPLRNAPPGLTTAVPDASKLRASVPVVDGVAEIDFSTRVGEFSLDAQKQLSAQVAWTLRQVPAVTDVRITGDGTVVAPSGDAVQDASGWASFGPDKSRRWVFVVTGGSVLEVGPDSQEPMTGVWGEDDQGATMVTRADERTLAVWPDRARFTARDDGPVDISGVSFLRPVIDVDGFAWLVDQPQGRTRIRVHDGESLALLRAHGLTGVSSFAVSPDGTRYAATARGRLLVGGIERLERQVLRLTRPSALPVEGQAREVVWVDGSRVAHLGAPGTQVQSVRIDGTDSVDGWPGGGQLLPEIEAVRLVATSAARPDLYILDGEGGVWMLDRTRWIPVDVPTARGLA